jgi:hypothetical protein
MVAVPVGCVPRPFGQSIEIIRDTASEEMSSRGEHGSETGGAEVVPSSLEDSGMDGLPENPSDERKIMCAKLFLQRPGVGADKHRASGRARKKRGGKKVRDALADAGGSFDEEMLRVFECLHDGERHRALLRARLEVWKIARPRVTGEEIIDLAGERSHTRGTYAIVRARSTERCICSALLLLCLRHHVRFLP